MCALIGYSWQFGQFNFTMWQLSLHLKGALVRQLIATVLPFLLENLVFIYVMDSLLSRWVSCQFISNAHIICLLITQVLFMLRTNEHVLQEFYVSVILASLYKLNLKGVPHFNAVEIPNVLAWHTKPVISSHCLTYFLFLFLTALLRYKLHP